MSALSNEPPVPPDEDLNVPGWSGAFTEFIPRMFGVLAIHADDTRTHKFPAGWHAATDEPIYLHDAELWPLVCEECMEGPMLDYYTSPVVLAELFEETRERVH